MCSGTSREPGCHPSAKQEMLQDLPAKSSPDAQGMPAHQMRYARSPTTSLGGGFSQAHSAPSASRHGRPKWKEQKRRKTPATAGSSLNGCKHAEAATHQAISIQSPVGRLDPRTTGTQKAGLIRPLHRVGDERVWSPLPGPVRLVMPQAWFSPWTTAHRAGSCHEISGEERGKPPFP